MLALCGSVFFKGFKGTSLFCAKCRNVEVGSALSLAEEESHSVGRFFIEVSLMVLVQLKSMRTNMLHFPSLGAEPGNRSEANKKRSS